MPSPTIASASGTSIVALAGRIFWPTTTTAMTAIQVMLMTPSTTGIAINPALEPTQSSPNTNPERAFLWHCRRKRRLMGVSSYTPAAVTTTPAATVPWGRYKAYTATPTTAQTAMYDTANTGAASRRPLAWVRRNRAGTAPGSIIAAIIEAHDAAKKPKEPSLVATPMSMPRIWSMAITQHAAAAPRVAVSAAAVVAVVQPGIAPASW